MKTPLEQAIQIRDIYIPGFEFPKWVIDPRLWSTHSFTQTIVFYHKEDSLEDVKRLCLEREPCNIGMSRIYNKKKLEEIFGWSLGAYRSGMPNIAVYCHATIHTEAKGFFNVHVLNLIGCALDSMGQPDYTTFNTKEKVLHFYQQMWNLALGAMKSLGKRKFQIYNVGGGAFSGPYGDSFITDIFEPAFLPLLPEFEAAGIEVIGYDTRTHRFTGGYIPDCLDEPTQDLENTVYVNAWDPWSLIGNGNERDGSLDGYWGRCSNMSVLGWSMTNPEMKFSAV
jgi:hypothetical protein